MQRSDSDIDRLDALLKALPLENGPMTLGELDGYIVGVLACPEMIPPSEWLPEVWGATGEADFPDRKSAEETIGAVMAHYNTAVQAINASLWVEPIYLVDPEEDDVLWEPWVDGFTRAMRLRPETWSRFLDHADDETRSTMIFLMALHDIDTGQSKFTDDEIEQIDAEAPDLIPNCVATILHQSRPELSGGAVEGPPEMPFRASSRPNRNDPCSCGSGRKYKTCCGRH
ncbi:MAG: UPF0149 family protein [Alteraurantiacibacter sp.]